jgi:hypothetical protein
MPWLIITLIIIAIIVLVVWLSRKLSQNTRPEIYGQTCPQCGSKKARWAGYADRKECAKCGKIFG